MKVIFCTYDDKAAVNGINTWLLNLLPSLKSNGVDISLIYDSWVSEEDCTTIPMLKKLGIPCKRIGSNRYLESQVTWILKHVSNEKPDIFVANHILPAWYAAEWLNPVGIPTIGVINNDDQEYHTLIKEFLYSKKNYINSTVAVSETLFEMLPSDTAFTCNKKIPYGTPPFNQFSRLTKNESFRIFYVGRLANVQKNIAIVTKCLCEAAYRFPNVEVYIFGSGPDSDRVREIVDSYNLPHQIHIMGIVENTTIRELLPKANVITLMSDFEGLPVALIEAMAAGVVPLCKKTSSGLKELIIDDITGLYVEDIEEFVKKIEYLLTNPAQWERISTNARNHIEKGYSFDKVVDDWIGLFDILRGKNKQEYLKVPSKIRLPKNNIGKILGERREPNFFLKVFSKIKRVMSELL
ncbi:glycosyltransferase [Pedobacter frigidisoli]|uniref:Glycosyltransferase n=1 Tax=Pedobacter frigidisoli TaxID=2530455 RepID=A0A4R0P2Z2_9SPHI|nr:glycosyltransferase family 4 protein [Pedobacter frigidisoli]TCD07728.1 glycosyltransferase [Pedobacter frigidisoli]